MKKYKDFINISDLKRLCESIGREQGLLDADPVSEEDWNKCEYKGKRGFGDGKSGDKVKIIWNSECDDMIDEGYIFSLPGRNSEDIYMSGIVHIPCPYVEKAANEPEWWTLAELCENKLVKKIIIT